MVVVLPWVTGGTGVVGAVIFLVSAEAVPGLAGKLIAGAEDGAVAAGLYPPELELQATKEMAMMERQKSLFMVVDW